MCYNFFPPFVTGMLVKWLLFHPSNPNLFIFQLLMPQIKFHWCYPLCKIHEKKNAFQVHKLLSSLCLPEHRAIFTFPLFQRSFSPLKITAYQWGGTTNNELTPEQCGKHRWIQLSDRWAAYPRFYLSFVCLSGERRRLLDYFLSHYTFYDTRYSGGMEFSCYSLA